jgi:predicted type IV restriction endonuclease
MACYLFNFSRKGAAKGRTLREQAAELLDLGLWGIGEKTPLRTGLAPDDKVLIYVGAPERAFIGHARLATALHPWSPTEAVSYPGNFTAGVAFAEAEVWPHPVLLGTVLPTLVLQKTNPGAHFFAGVIRLDAADYSAVVDAATGTGETATLALQEAKAPEVSIDNAASNQLFTTVEKLKQYSEHAGLALSEYDTRANFIDKYLDALGYTNIEDVQRGSSVETGNFPDYVLLVNGTRVIAIEAKKLGSSLGVKEAAQVVQYCSTLGLRWGAVTDGRYMKVYDAPVLGVPPHERQVLAVDLLDYKDRADFDARIFPELELLAKSELESGAGLDRRATQEAIREILTTPQSTAVGSLRHELEEKRKIHLTDDETTEFVSELFS